MNRVVNCQTEGCGAKVDYDGRWLTGRYSSGTSLNFHVTGEVKERHCPACRKPLPDPSLNLPMPVPTNVGTM